LLVFGPAAKTRVWLVLDGETAYLDRNANGDLTENGEALVVKPGRQQAHRAGLGTITPVKGKETYRLLYLDRDVLLIEVREGFDQYACLGYADRPGDAPVYHFDGPLGLWVAGPQDLEGGLVRGGQPQQLPRVSFGTRILDRDGKPLTAVGVVCDRSHPWAKLQLPSRGFPKDVHPVAEIEYPARREGVPTVKKTYPLDLRC
jgi:hypothetical protein